MHRLLILNRIQPEDYHRDCFIEVLLGRTSLPHQPRETAHLESLLTEMSSIRETIQLQSKEQR
jgi:hypothetical protein